MINQNEPIYRNEDHELMGYIRKVDQEEKWELLTVFNYKFGEIADKDLAISEVKLKGLQILSAQWEYFSKENNSWNICLILEASPDFVKIQDGFYPNKDAEVLVLQKPTEDELRLLN